MNILNYPENGDDTLRIQSVLRAYGYDATLAECEKLWAYTSDDFAAQWLILPESDIELWEQIERRVRGAIDEG